MTYIPLRCPYCLEVNLYENKVMDAEVKCFECGALFEKDLTQ